MTRIVVSFLIITLLSCKVENNEIFHSDKLSVQQINEKLFMHVSYLQTNSFGLVSCNGMVYMDGDEAIVFDTPVNNDASLDLISWIQESMNKKVKALVVTHFHEDCLGGIESFHTKGIESFGSKLTIELADELNYELPKNSFDNKMEFTIGTNKVVAEFFGEGHTIDNIVGYIAHEKALFGGCLIKSLKAGQGNLEDANTAQWPATVNKIHETYPDLKIVVPGHGNYGDSDLLNYTIQLFLNK